MFILKTFEALLLLWSSISVLYAGCIVNNNALPNTLNSRINCLSSVDFVAYYLKQLPFET